MCVEIQVYVCVRNTYFKLKCVLRTGEGINCDAKIIL